MEQKQIPINKIQTDPDQPRKTFDQEEIKDLAKSIQKHGLLQNIIVRKQNENYILIAGERRLKACTIAGLKQINCNIINNEKHQEISLIENIQRVQLNPIEEAKAIKNLIKQQNLTQEQAGQILGKNRIYITNKLRLLNLPETAQEALKNNLTEGHGKILLSIKNKSHQKRLLEEIQTNQLTVQETKQRADQLSKAQKTKTKIPQIKPNQPDKYLEKALENLENQLNRKITLTKTKTGGQINLTYYSQEDLENLITTLTQTT